MHFGRNKLLLLTKDAKRANKIQAWSDPTLPSPVRYAKFESIRYFIDIDIFQKSRYIDNRYFLSIYRTGLGSTESQLFVKFSNETHNA